MGTKRLIAQSFSSPLPSKITENIAIKERKTRKETAVGKHNASKNEKKEDKRLILPCSFHEQFLAFFL